MAFCLPASLGKSFPMFALRVSVSTATAALGAWMISAESQNDTPQLCKLRSYIDES